MPIDHELFIHESDRAALNALKSIPGFTQVLRSFMKVWNEKQFKLLNMSTFVKVSEEQMSKYHDMLIPICKKLNIAVPELYVSLSPVANAYTSGDTEPFIVMTSGLINTVPEELIPTVLAHECGHIACHHVLYSTMGRLILGGATEMLGLSSLITTPLQMAFYYWMRCSEYSADRAAAVCDLTGDKTVEMCMRLAGFDKNIPIAANKQAFLAQAAQYKQLVDDSKFNKTLEFLMFNRMNHPLNAVRAYECDRWTNSSSFSHIVRYMQEEERDMMHSYVPVAENIGSYVGRNVTDVAYALRQAGFTNISEVRSTESKGRAAENSITAVTVNDRYDVKQGQWLPADASWLLTYYSPLSHKEQQDAHPGQVCVPGSSVSYMGRNYQEVVDELRALGFTNFSVTEQADIKVRLLLKEGSIAHISIDHQDRFDRNTWFNVNAPVSIRYHVMAQ
ncbi:MAG: M48 family metallopeptidase [Ruminococcus sp.]|nr:M48 family metallopeptidase [Ruminococcus sp.]